jgi:hypothetical protein
MKSLLDTLYSGLTRIQNRDRFGVRDKNLGENGKIAPIYWQLSQKTGNISRTAPRVGADDGKAVYWGSIGFQYFECQMS